MSPVSPLLEPRSGEGEDRSGEAAGIIQQRIQCH